MNKNLIILVSILLVTTPVTLSFRTENAKSSQNSPIITDGFDTGHDRDRLKSPIEELPIDINFISSIIQELSNVTFENKSWLGREYGTPGNQYAAKMLGEIWNETISNEYIDNASLDLIDKKRPFDGIDDTYGVRSRDDYKLVINGEEIPDTECYPIPPMPLGIPIFDKHFDFNDAELHIVPDEAYKLASINIQQCANDLIENEYLLSVNEEIENIQIQGKSSSIFGGESSIGVNKHIYLIEAKKFEKYNITLSVPSIRVVAEELYYFTKSNPGYPAANAFLCADYREDVHIEGPSVVVLENEILGGIPLHIPGLLINGSLGNKLNQSMAEGKVVTVDLALHAYVDRNAKSYNVVGTIPGKVADKTVVIGAHYDSGWNQCTIDNAVGVGVMFGIAKYFSDNYDNNNRSNYTMKFVAFSGEESVCRGSKFYVWKNYFNGKEKIQCYINLDALGYINRSDYPKENLSLNFWFYPRYDELKDLLQEIADNSNYQSRSGGYNITVQTKDDSGINLCDGYSFKDVVKKAVICFDKGNPKLATHWYTLDGENHTKGDTIDMVDWADVYVTAEVILNTTRLFALSEYSGSNDASETFIPLVSECIVNKNIETIESRVEEFSYDVNSNGEDYVGT